MDQPVGRREGFLRVDDGRQGLVGDRDFLRGVLGDVAAVRDDRGDPFAGIMDGARGERTSTTSIRPEELMFCNCLLRSMLAKRTSQIVINNWLNRSI
jgi:hypothetical protein